MICFVAFVTLTEKFPVRPQSVDRKDVVNDMAGIDSYVRNCCYQPKRENGFSSLVIPLVVEEDVVIMMIVLQDLNQGFLSLRARPRKCMGAQS